MIGLEVHCQLNRLESKLFCPCRADYRGMEPNENTCPVCMGLPGTLPRLNREAVRKAAALAISLNCPPSRSIAFFRKNYFYPDLPKNFQITQLNIYGQDSIGGSGKVSVDGGDIRIERIQLEEDPGRISRGSGNAFLVDYNRAGAPLVEIVTKPDFDGPRQARNFMRMLADTAESLGVADPYLEGAMRADGNVSTPGGGRVEIKNVSSFHDLEKALHFEATRQRSLLDRGIPVPQETRHWDEGRRITVQSRAKEEDTDYRYFLEGDIPRVVLSEDDIRDIRESVPEVAATRLERYVSEYDMPRQVAASLVADRFCCDLFEMSHTPKTAKLVANMITTDMMGMVDTREKRASCMVTSDHIRALAEAVQEGNIRRAQAKRILYDIVRNGGDVSSMIIEAAGSGGDLAAVVGDVLRENPKAAEAARANPQAVHYLVGMVMKKTRGAADPRKAREEIESQL